MPKRWSKKHAERYFWEAVEIAQEWEEESWHYGRYHDIDGKWDIEKRFKIRRNKDIQEWVDRLNMRVKYERRRGAIKILQGILDGVVAIPMIPAFIKGLKDANKG